MSKSIKLAKVAFVENRLENAVNYLLELLPICQLAYDMQNVLRIN